MPIVRKSAKSAGKTPIKKAPAKPAAKKPAAKRTTPKVSPLAGKAVEAYLAKIDPGMAALIQALRPLIKAAAPEAVEVVKWAQPVYEINGPFAYIRAFTHYVSLGFWRGATLPSGASILEGDGDRMRHLKLRSAADIKPDLISALVREAVALNRKIGDPTQGN
ncbi:MAG: DUF1801 domain-containing protein [Thermoflexales bacterium]